ncbi:hypothetical protein P170DRAFT_164937 [Aspergillus steynii IBT 23096]|uniref:Uncharacterized protein n=1 Tax=Aspergillus steynii IBT 23096 TaxID=1392250 RepID=A0A2I2GEV2_9EURO|nr:uncharacterized protein P170DRAFT_164937 [Aspergillus steynii IBT 23096]PLB51381.1 hypothetical protein P170DRAFT_164937 [Aspergillus steynii IBT 23096]
MVVVNPGFHFPFILLFLVISSPVVVSLSPCFVAVLGCHRELSQPNFSFAVT